MPRRAARPILPSMILAPVNDPMLRATVRRAALPDEDVFHEREDVLRGYRLGFPRLLVCRSEDRARLPADLEGLGATLPILTLTRSSLLEWNLAWQADGIAASRIDDTALRLRRLIQQAATRSVWVDGFFGDLTALLGGSLPGELRGFARRVLEFPGFYQSLQQLQGLAGLSPGALKARFRRRGLPSPSLYLRWFRVFAAARILSEPGQTVLAASFRLGFGSDGNFCRWVRGISGLPPSALRTSASRMLLMARMVEGCFAEGTLEGWQSISGLFLRRVA